jgi:hypothetical protein
MRAGFANLAVQAASGQKINFGEALTSAAIGGNYRRSDSRK